ncbi:putative plastid-lipid-associated protein 13 [Nymphaea thermarum]|nr:putative plastid-lipid-associated protein 13 [Nymphaea thermarum]
MREKRKEERDARCNVENPQLEGEKTTNEEESFCLNMISLVNNLFYSSTYYVLLMLVNLFILFQFKDSGGLDALLSGKTTDVQRIDVNERITSLERLNPTPRPTTSPFLEGRWNFEWFGAGTPGLFAARILLERFPSPVAKLLGLDVLIKESYAKSTASLQLFNSIETKFIITTKLAVEGPLRMSEEYTEGVIERPFIREEALPEQLKGAYEQAVGALQQLPLPIRDFMSDGLKVPLGEMLEILSNHVLLDYDIIRNTAGVPDVLSRLEADSGSASVDSTPEYES